MAVREAILVGGNFGGSMLYPPSHVNGCTIDRRATGLVAEIYEWTRLRDSGFEIWACPNSVMFNYLLSFQGKQFPPIIKGICRSAVLGTPKQRATIESTPATTKEHLLQLIEGYSTP